MEYVAGLISVVAIAIPVVLMMRYHIRNISLSSVFLQVRVARWFCLCGPFFVVLIICLTSPLRKTTDGARILSVGYVIGVCLLFAVAYGWASLMYSIELHYVLRRYARQNKLVEDNRLVLFVRRNIRWFHWLHRILLARSETTPEKLFEEVCGRAVN